MCLLFVCRRVPKLPRRWKTAKWLTAQHRQKTWGQRWDNTSLNEPQFWQKLSVQAPSFSILLLCHPICDSVYYALALASLPSFFSFSISFKSIFSHWAKALIHLTLSKDVVLQWLSYYSLLPAPRFLHPIPTVLKEGAVLLPMPVPSADMASLASLGADGMRA